ncbi:aquaporin Z [Microbacterium paludicola]|uniref:Aquaporin Z n=1 Tax=Microbacterium paludicola TaxID=300019 RepID=A0A4Y9G032_9MICO|nr:aquaporin [Microbacterium paludicola]MBF0815186.1 aquaporin [Microbacterium paludicola]TFU34442.1 aquaporin Z [Microbacterium paludicola]
MTDPNPEQPVEPTELAHTPPPAPSASAKLVAEAFGTLLLVLGGVGTAVFASNHFADTPAAVYTAVALAFGLTVVVGAYAFGPISGGHFNPAVTLGLAAAGRFPWRETGGYIVAQVIGGAIATTLLVLIGLFGPANWLTTAQDAGFASNGWDALSPAGFGLVAAIIAEVILTGLFLLIILGVTHPTRGTPLAGLAIGLSLALIHFISIPVDNTSVNPARSIATAIYGGGDALAQLWVFIVFPIVGALLAGFAYKALFDGVNPARPIGR